MQEEMLKFATKAKNVHSGSEKVQQQNFRLSELFKRRDIKRRFVNVQFRLKTIIRDERLYGTLQYKEKELLSDSLSIVFYHFPC